MVASSYRQVFFVLGGGGGVEFASDQVSPKKEIPMEPKPKSSAAGCGLKGLVTVEGMLMWCRSQTQACQLVLDPVDIALSHGRSVRTASPQLTPTRLKTPGTLLILRDEDLYLILFNSLNKPPKHQW